MLEAKIFENLKASSKDEKLFTKQSVAKTGQGIRALYEGGHVHKYIGFVR